MKRIIPIVIFFFLLVLLFPNQAFAVEYSITEARIDAYLQENGDVLVEESFTYGFEGKFNGITREIIPKKGTEINNFEASEKGKALKVERDDYFYKIHRKGSDEVVLVDLSYTIKNGVEVYSDVAQFYWAFFDRSNESTYENLIVAIHPPKETEDVIAFGYDQAYGTEEIMENGTVYFAMNQVPDNTNGDIRVAYEKGLFPAAKASNQPMKAEIIQDKKDLDAQVAAKTERTAFLDQMASIVIPIVGLIMVVLYVSLWKGHVNRKREAERDMDLTRNVPKQRMSLPATIFYTNYKHLPPEAISAALLDLVRKQYVKRIGEDRFQVIHREGALKHEQILIKWLFDLIGENNEFSFEELKQFTKQKKNHGTYRKYQTSWQKAVAEEVNERQLYEDKKKYRISIVLSSIILIPFIFIFAFHGLIFWMVMTILLIGTITLYGFLYHPRTKEGTLIHYEWKACKKRFKILSKEDWRTWAEDDKLRAYIYGLGTKTQPIIKKNEQFAKSFYPSNTSNSEVGAYSTMDISTFIILGAAVSNNFDAAHQSTGASIGAGGAGSGAGAGGGGGGSGAF
ncbi:DUF2207 domain-containing protein [Pseudalkalibacillus berkeleyi]|uniref:DUF2207 domain-containing protein n=1 Tax=Pseudalkalibacillus berkeleyi TaxID=1069813 RepID=A0ABS9GUL3_9BACL|nr:DUF2207 domain-containing protein [Pseudalkalibacillus berkeleyi]MCF6136527.1 DUF2207 domain-containing protein [Pseudalkalibacillus berkeleyi]